MSQSAVDYENNLIHVELCSLVTPKKLNNISRSPFDTSLGCTYGSFDAMHKVISIASHWCVNVHLL